MGTITPINPQVVYVQATTPTDVTEGKLWYNTTNNKTYASDGSSYVLVADVNFDYLDKQQLEQNLNILINGASASSTLNDYDTMFVDIYSDATGYDNTINTTNTTAINDGGLYKNYASSTEQELDLSGYSFTNGGTQTASAGIWILTGSSPITLNGGKTTSICNATRIKCGTTAQGTELGTGTITSNVGTFSSPIELPANTEIFITCDSSGGAYYDSYDGSCTWNNPAGGEFTFKGRVDWAGNHAEGTSINCFESIDFGVNLAGGDYIVETNALSVTTGAVSHQLYCPSTIYGTGSITYDISFDNGSTWDTDQPLNTKNTSNSTTGTQAIIKINLNGTDSSNYVTTSGYGLMLYY